MAFTDALNTSIKLQCYNSLNENDTWAMYPFKKYKYDQAIQICKHFAVKKSHRYNRSLIYVAGNDKPVFKFIDGIDVSGQEPKQYYGAKISKYKLKIKLKGDINLPPFYSNTDQTDIQVFDTYINRYIRTLYKQKLISALIYQIDGKQEQLVAQIRKKTGRIEMNASLTIGFVDIDLLYPLPMKKVNEHEKYGETFSI